MFRLSALQSKSDTITYVYKSDGLKNQQAGGYRAMPMPMMLRDQRWFETERQVYLSNPAGQEDEDVNLLPEMNGKRKKKEAKKKKDSPATPSDNLKSAISEIDIFLNAYWLIFT